MRFRNFLIYVIVFCLTDLALWFLAPFGMGIWCRMLFLLPTLALALCLPFIRFGIRYTETMKVFSYITFIIEVPIIVAVLFCAVLRNVAGLSFPLADGIAAALGAIVSLTFIVLIFFVSRHLRINRVDLSFEGLPEGFDGLRICQLSDMHLGSFGGRCRYVKRIIDAVGELSPELILFTGDLVNFQASEALPYLGELSRLSAPMGVYAILGNHDYMMHGKHYSEERKKTDTARLLEMEKGLGWHLLLNDNVTLTRNGGSIALAGVENISTNPAFTNTGGDLEKALSGLPDSMFTILLSHDPSHWGSEVVSRGGVPLTLSGHTHGLNLKIVGKSAHWRLPFPRGLYTRDGYVLHVSRGLGSSFAFRLGVFPRIDLITLNVKK